VPQSYQLELARRLEAPVVRVDSDHLAPVTTPGRFHRKLCESLDVLEGLCDRERVQLRSVSQARG
jgi:hypothetical protein